jgi:hypothetical protein
MARGGKRPNAGRKGPDKIKLDIQAFIRDNVDFVPIINAMVTKAEGGSERAATLLFEYGYGKPVEIKKQESGDTFSVEIKFPNGEVTRV